MIQIRRPNQSFQIRDGSQSMYFGVANGFQLYTQITKTALLKMKLTKHIVLPLVKLLDVVIFFVVDCDGATGAYA